MFFTRSEVLDGSWVPGSVYLPRVCALGPWGCSSACSCFLVGLVLAILLCLIWPYRIGVQRRWLEFFFFSFFWDYYCFWGRFTIFIS